LIKEFKSKGERERDAERGRERGISILSNKNALKGPLRGRDRETEAGGGAGAGAGGGGGER
jgi:hypothetical protein